MYEEKLSQFLNLQDYKSKLDTFNLNAGENCPGKQNLVLTFPKIFSRRK